MNDNSTIVLNINKEFYNPLKVLIYSIISNTKSKISFKIVITEKIEDFDDTDLKRLKNKFFNFDYEFINEKNAIEKAKKLITNKKELDEINLALQKCVPYKFRFVRFFYPLIFNTLNQIIYLDVDTLFLDDISKLKKYSNQGIIVGAKEKRTWFKFNLRKSDRIFFKNNYHGKRLNYINSGVLLLNLEKLREVGYTYKLTKWSYKHEILEPMFDKQRNIWDQDALNLVFYDQIKYFPMSWNFVKSNHYRLRYLFLKKKVIHWTGKIKPWESKWHHFNRFVKIWKKYEKELNKNLNSK